MNEDEHITMEVISSLPAHDAQIVALTAENLLLRDNIAGLEREVDALRQQVADLLLPRAD